MNLPSIFPSPPQGFPRLFSSGCSRVSPIQALLKSQMRAFVFIPALRSSSLFLSSLSILGFTPPLSSRCFGESLLLLVSLDPRRGSPLPSSVKLERGEAFWDGPAFSHRPLFLLTLLDYPRREILVIVFVGHLAPHENNGRVFFVPLSISLAIASLLYLTLPSM